jgi:ribosomal protein S18 acetylase RimI-like enzyme
MQITVRPAVVEDARAIAAVHVASWRTTYRDILDEVTLSQLSVERRTAGWRASLTEYADQNVVYVAEDETGEVVGFVSGGEERDGDPEYSGELYAIYLLAEIKGYGIGRKLATTLLNHLRTMGHSAILVWVLDENPAKHFYAAMGALPVRERVVEIADADYRELGYGWHL